MRHLLTSARALVAGAPGPLAALTPPGTEEEPSVLIVEGSRLGQRLAETGAAVTILTAEDLEGLGFAFLADALATAPGVTVNQTGAFGGASAVRIRGAGTDQTLVLMDGVPVGDTSSVGGAFDFARLDIAQVERVEIIRGPQSTLWGSEAIGGIVSITTKKGAGGASAFAEAGSFGTVRGGGALSGRDASGGWRIAASGITSDGISKADEAEGNREADGHRGASLSASLDHDFGPLLLDASVFGSTAETEFDSFDFLAPGFIADGDERSETDELTASVRLRTKDRGGLTHTLLAGGSLIERRNFSDAAPGFAASGQRAILRYQGNAPVGDRVTLAFGGEADLRETDDQETAILSAFALAEVKPLPGLTLSGGLRVDDHEAFGAETTGRASAAWDIRQGITLRASWGQGFKAPSLFQETFFCCGAAEPNPSLAPERSEGFDAGILLTAPRLTVDLGVFRQDTEDLIDFSFADGAYVNIRRAETKGLEFAARADILTWLDIAVSYAFIEAEDESGQPLARIPRHSGDVAFQFDPAGPWSGNLLVRHNGEEEDSFGVVDAWTRLDANARYALSPRLELYARAENLLDADYQQVFGYGTPGRSGLLGVRIGY